ncbi:MAG: orotidine-5'-phosphate decarboxylase [Bacteroidetes bacterium]|nr:orotidine-5'-phosphate decarboxylase [Bacteroidota bacterium]MBL6963379.1 orotidine-5'-phosphate decarboxylase [Bacteroidota bacterium]
MNRTQIIEEIRRKKSFLCIGLDTDMDKIPEHLKSFQDPIFEFNKAVIDATNEFAVAYKLNLAFYERHGVNGLKSLEKTVNYIPEGIFKIADAKRGDIGNTSKQYAKTFFETYAFDAITLSPYMGSDSIGPFLEFKDKWVIILALTSNQGSKDFQMLKTGDDYLYEQVFKTSSKWGNTGNIMYVVGATHPEAFSGIRKIIPQHFILIPGVGAQGGTVRDIARYALNDETGVLVNVSRGVIFPGNDEDFPINIKDSALKYQQQMAEFIN